MLQIFNLSKSFGERVLLKDASFSLVEGDKLGLVGRNGTGKSTLFKMILGEESYDGGEIRTPRNYRIGYLSQHLEFSKDNIIAECAQALPREEKDDVYKVEKILMGLGFVREDFSKSPLDFSGGQQIRFNLCKVLLQMPELLLLDEPTNYLDIVGLRWLADFLKNYPREMIIITHDRSFMDQVCNRVMGIYRQSIRSAKGGVDSYYAALEEEDLIHEKTRINQEKKIQEAEDFINRFRAKARKASVVQSRQKMIDKIERIEELQEDQVINFRFPYKECPGKILLEARGIEFFYEKDKVLFSNLNFHIRPGDRLAVIGKNGKGKSTLLSVLAQELASRRGEIWQHPSLAVGYFGQTNINRLFPDNSILQEIQNENMENTAQQVRNIAGTMLFPGDDALKKIKVLSGGERSRVLLGKILSIENNLLLLDEPTNHLDLESIDAMLEGLRSFAGGIAIVTHDEGIIRKFANKLVIFHRDHAELYDGSYDEFLEKFGWDDGLENSSLVDKSKKSGGRKKERALLVQEMNKATHSLRKKIETLEQGIIAAEELLEQKRGNLLTLSQQGGGQEINNLAIELRALENSIETHFSELEKLVEQKDELEEDYKKKMDDL